MVLGILKYKIPLYPILYLLKGDYRDFRVQDLGTGLLLARS